VEPQQTAGEAAPDDAPIHSEGEKKLEADPVLSQFDISTLVESGNVKIMGSVTSTALKQQVERAIRSVKGVSGVDNQLVISEATP
jgi:osmotically-inducible protein OsmY